ncbi:MAG: aminoglycoside 6-adenylyltransferase [Halarsenatibacteraceae bacterium]
MNEFWWNAYYVSKYLWREEITFAKYLLDNILRYSYFDKIIDWYIEIDNDFEKPSWYYNLSH